MAKTGSNRFSYRARGDALAALNGSGAGDHFEISLRTRGFSRIAGVDEAGRGPLAGPVVAAAVVLPAPSPGQTFREMLALADLAGLDDSKRLAPHRRAAFAGEILKHASVGLAALPAEVIDRENIRAASLRAMRLAVAALPLAPDFALVDGRDIPDDLICPAEAIVAGDHLSVSIAAASILAKVIRDGMMATAAGDFPGYGFERHAGYPTATHRAALAARGPCPLHRLTFGPVRKRDTEKFDR